MANTPEIPSPNKVLYAIASVFGPPGLTGPPEGATYNAVYNSGFSTIILWSLFVHPNGDIIYGIDQPPDPPNHDVIASNGIFNENFAELQTTITALKTNGPVRIVLFSIGVGEENSAWFNMLQLINNSPTGASTIQSNFQAILKGIPALDGFDFDNEDNGLNAGSAKLMADVTKWVTDNGTNGKIVTFCPALGGSGPPATAVWVKTMKLIAEETGGPQPVLWWNVQAYGGDPIGGWVRGYAAGAGFSATAQAARNIVPGLIANDDGPAAVKSQVATWKSGNPGLDGAFLFHSGMMSPWTPGASSATAYANAIEQGLGETSRG